MRLNEMRERRIGMPSLLDCKPVYVVHGNVVLARYNDIYDALENLGDYPVKSDVVDRAAYDRGQRKVYAHRVAAEFVPMSAPIKVAKEAAA